MVGVWGSQPPSRCADWMSLLPPDLSCVPLWDLAIPGSHDTMTYCLDERSPVLPSQPKILIWLDRLIPLIIRPCIKKWATTQDLSVSSQLDSGIRFLDLRIAQKLRDPSRTFYFAHGIYSRITVTEGLSDITQWLKRHPKEVVLIALSAFDNMTIDQHSILFDLLRKAFGRKICPSSEIPSLKTCWTNGYQVIISYNDPFAYMHPELWSRWDYWWADKADPEAVISYLEEKKLRGRPYGFFMAGVNLTEDTQYVLWHLTQSMKSMTLKAYSQLMDWVQKQQPGSQETAINIFCADFAGVRANEFCEIVIGLNREKIKKDSQGEKKMCTFT